MESRNPVFSRSEAFTSNRGYATFRDVPPASPETLEQMYTAPAATGVDTGRMTMDDVVVKTGLLFAVLLPAAAVNYWLASPLLTFGGMIAGLVLGLVISLKGSTNAGLILTYAGLEGLFVGGLSRAFEAQWNGIVPQAVLATLAVFATCLFLYKSGRVRVTSKFRRVALTAMIGYAVFCLINLVLSMFNVFGPWGLRDGFLGLAIGAFAVVLASMMLMLDFDFAEQGVRNGIPERYSWLAAFGLVVTLVWLYIELLRLISILRGED